MTVSDWSRLVEWLLFVCCPVLFALAVLWVLTPVEPEEVVLLTVDPDWSPYGREPYGERR